MHACYVTSGRRMPHVCAHSSNPACKRNLWPPRTCSYVNPHIGIASHVYTSAASSLRGRRIDIALETSLGATQIN